MWRKQEEPKNASSAPEVAATQRVESVPPVSGSAIPSRESPAPVSASRLTSALTIKGEVTGRDDLVIDGQLEGLIRLDGGKVTVGPAGRVTANIDAREIVVHGKVKGGLQGRERVQIGATGHATGDIATRRISIEDGAEVHGRVEIIRVEESRPPRPVAVPTSAEVAVPVAAAAVQAKEPSAAA